MTTPDPIVIEVIKLLKYSIWPVILLITLLLFHSPLSRLLDRMQNFEFSKSENTLTIKAALELDRAERDRDKNNIPSTGEIATTVENANTQLKRRGADSPINVLWVDDNPGNNEREREAFTTLGFIFTLAKSTKEAKSRLSAGEFNLIISDFRRDEDPEAGYGLLEYINGLDKAPPYIIYAASATPELIAEAKSKGAFGETNRPSELMRLAVSAIAQKN